MASVTYKIGGKYDGKGIQSAKKDLSDLAGVIKGLAVIKVAQQLNKIAQATKGVFVEQNKALASFNTAVAKSGQELSKLNSLKKELSHGNFIDDDSLNKAMTFGMQMGLNAEQLEKVTKTAVNMASAGVKPLDKAMKELTTTALKNEDALDEISKKYDGFADAMSNTFSGRDAQWSNSLSDLKASIGAIPKSLEFLTQGKLLEPLNKITQWLVDNRNQIINFFLNLPSIFKVIGTELTNMLKRTFENMPEWISNIGVYFVQIFKDGFSTMFTVAKETFSGMMSLLDFAIGNPFRTSKDFINTMLNNLIEGINGLAQKLPKWAKKLIDAEDGDAITFRFSTGGSDANKTWNETAKKIEQSMSNVIKAYKDGANKTKEDWLKILDATTDFYKDDIDSLKTRLSEILGKALPKELEMALSGMSGYIGESSATTSESSSSGSSFFSGAKQVGSTALSNTGEIGSLVQSIIDNGIWGAIAELIAKILSRVEEVLPIFEVFQNMFSELFDMLINPDSGIIKSITDMLQPFFNGFNAVKDILSSILGFVSAIIDAFTPVFEGLTAILNKIAPIIASIFDMLALIFRVIGVIGQMITPIVKTILEVISPVLEVINWIIKAIYKVIATIINICIDIYNVLKPFWFDSINHISTDMNSRSVYDGYETWDAQTSATALAQATSNSASYTSAKDIYITIQYNNSFVNGDARQIALQLREEIRSAERLGY